MEKKKQQLKISANKLSQSLAKTQQEKTASEAQQQQQQPEFEPGQFQSLCHGQRAIAAAAITQRGVIWNNDGMDDFEKGFLLLGLAEVNHQQVT